MRRLLALAVGLAFLLLSSACTSNGAEEPAPIPNDEPDGSAAPADSDGEEEDEGDEIDITTVPSDPEDIDVEYVQAVMDEIDDVILATAIVIGESGSVNDANVRELMFSAYTEADGETHLQGFENIGIENIKDDPQAPETTNIELLEKGEDCLFLTANRTFQPLFSNEANYEPVQPYYLRLLRREPGDLNPTTWQIDFDTYFPSSEDVPEGDGCSA